MSTSDSTIDLTRLIAIDIETTGLSRRDEIVSAAIAKYGGSSIHTESFWLDRFFDSSEADNSRFEKVIRETLLCKSFPGMVVFHNLDFDLRFILDRYAPGVGVSDLPNLADTLTLSRVARNNKYVSHTHPRKLKCHSLKYLAKEHLGIDHVSFDEVVDQANIRLADRHEVLSYNEKDAELTLRLFDHFSRTLSRSEWRYVAEIEMPHLMSLVQMNMTGVPFDGEEGSGMRDSLTALSEELQRKIFRAVGRTFNPRAPREVAAAIFFNHKLTYRPESGAPIPLVPLFMTEAGQAKVDVETLSLLRKRIMSEDSQARAVEVLEWVLQLLEANQNIAKLERLMEHSRVEAGELLFPNFSASAKSGRIKSSSPNLLGLSKKVFKKGAEFVPTGLKEMSVRHLLAAPAGHKVVSIDVSALDLSVITFGAKKFNTDFLWAGLFGSASKVDIHLTVASRVFPEKLNEVLNGEQDLPTEYGGYWFSGLDKDKRLLGLIEVESNTLRSVELSPAAFKNLSTFRKTMKEVNLSSAYMIGATQLAKNIQKKAGYDCGQDEARELLERFYSAFPEVRSFQDEVCNSVYEPGYFDSPFGRRFYPDCYDELNEFHRAENGGYQFVFETKGRFWLIEASHWKKFEGSVIDAGNVCEKPFGFSFSKIDRCLELEPTIFAKKGKSNSKFQRKSESSAEDYAPYQLSRIAITNEIDRALSFGTSMSSDAESLVSGFIREGRYLVPQKGIVLYRVETSGPASKYFRLYKNLETVSRKFFPLYCQGVANSLAIQALTFTRKEIERKKLKSRLLLFVHDQIDVLAPENEVEEIRSLLKEALRRKKPPFDVPLSGELEVLDHIRD